jgi:hypothetical protein
MKLLEFYPRWFARRANGSDPAAQHRRTASILANFDKVVIMVGDGNCAGRWNRSSIRCRAEPGTGRSPSKREFAEQVVRVNSWRRKPGGASWINARS